MTQPIKGNHETNKPSDRKTKRTGEIVVLTGSSGCLGLQTLRLLISHDAKVAEIRCLDLVEPSEWAKQSIRDELTKFEETKTSKQPGVVVSSKRVKYIRGDIRDINTVEAYLEGADCVLHCAARVDFWTEPEEQDRAELESINVQGTENLLKACVRLSVPKFVHVSSFEAFVSYHTIYYATESTLPEPKWLLFGSSAESKRQAENKVRQYSNNKLKRVKERIAAGDEQLGKRPMDSLNAVIIRFTPIYGPEDKYFVSRILRIAKLFNGKLTRFTNVWIRQQPIYVGNAAWSLIKAKQRMDVDESISGEDFHITDDTRIGDPFDFLEPFLECKDMHLGKSSLPAWPVWLLIVMLTFLRKSLRAMDIFGLFTSKRSRLDEAKERDRVQQMQLHSQQSQTKQRHTVGQYDHNKVDTNDDRGCQRLSSGTRWYHLITSQTFYFMCNSLFLNRTKASLRLDYEPLYSPEESMETSLEWYKNHLKL